MLKEYFKSFEKDRDFRSRTGRKEFWRAALPDVIIWVMLITFYFVFSELDLVFLALAVVYFLVTLTSRAALWVRRLHDTGIKGTFAFVALIPVLGWCALCFVFMSDSQPKNNEFGEYIPEPKKKDKKKEKKKK